jgi:hypothetical protein
MTEKPKIIHFSNSPEKRVAEWVIFGYERGVSGLPHEI